jgi:hypothetical protein
VVATQLTMAILGKEGKLVDGRFELLISRERRASQPSPMPDWLPDNIWTAANALKVHIRHLSCGENRKMRFSRNQRNILLVYLFTYFYCIVLFLRSEFVLFLRHP